MWWTVINKGIWFLEKLTIKQKKNVWREQLRNVHKVAVNRKCFKTKRIYTKGKNTCWYTLKVVARFWYSYGVYVTSLTHSVRFFHVFTFMSFLKKNQSATSLNLCSYSWLTRIISSLIYWLHFCNHGVSEIELLNFLEFVLFK